MSVAIAEIFQKTKNLSLEDRSTLIKGLINDIDLEGGEEIEKAWMEEVKNRKEEILNGKVQTIPYDDIKAELGWK